MEKNFPTLEELITSWDKVSLNFWVKYVKFGKCIREYEASIWVCICVGWCIYIRELSVIFGEGSKFVILKEITIVNSIV